MSSGGVPAGSQGSGLVVGVYVPAVNPVPTSAGVSSLACAVVASSPPAADDEDVLVDGVDDVDELVAGVVPVVPRPLDELEHPVADDAMTAAATAAQMTRMDDIDSLGLNGARSLSDSQRRAQPRCP